MRKFIVISAICILILAVIGGIWWWFFGNQNVNHNIKYTRAFDESGYEMKIKKVYKRDNDTVIALVQIFPPTNSVKKKPSHRRHVETTQTIAYSGVKNTKIEFVLFEDTKYFSLKDEERTELLHTYKQLKTFEEHGDFSVFWEDAEKPLKAERYEVSYQEKFRTGGNKLKLSKVFRVGYVIYRVVEYTPVQQGGMVIQVISDVSTETKVVDTKPSCSQMTFIIDSEGVYRDAVAPSEGKNAKFEARRHKKMSQSQLEDLMVYQWPRISEISEEFVFVMQSHEEYSALIEHDAAIILYDAKSKDK